MPQKVRIQLIAETKTQPAVQAVDELDKKVDQLADAWKKAGQAADETAKKGTQAGKTTTDSLGRVRDEFGRFVGGAKKATDSVTTFSNDAKKSFNSLGSTIKTVGASIIAYFAVDQLLNFGKKVIEVTSTFQKFEAVLTNTLGSQTAAQVALQQVSDIAAKTNFSVQELTDSYIKFANRGVKLTSEELTSLTDVANSTGKSFDQLTEAALDAFSGENERLKEFGITAKKTGETTQYTFKGVTTEVKNTQAAIKDYIIGLGKLEGVSGSTAAISKTLGGQISNFGDALDQLYLTIGKGLSGPLSKLIEWATDYVGWIKNAITSQEDFTNQVANMRADDFIKRFDKLDEDTKKAQIQRIHAYIDAQSELLVVERQLREQRQKINDDAAKEASRFGSLVVAGEVEKTAREKQLELDLQTNIKKIELIKNYYDERKKLAAQADKEEESGIISRLEETLKKLNKLRSLSNTQARIDDFTGQIEAGQRELARRLGHEKEFSLKSLDITKERGVQESRLGKLFNERYKHDLDEQLSIKADSDRILFEKTKEEEERIRALKEETYNVSAQFVDALFQLSRDRNQAALDDVAIKRDQELKLVGDNKQAQAFINAKFDREEAKLKQRQAVADKANALFGIGVNTALAIVKQLATTPLPLGAPFVALIAAAGAIQAAVVTARPIPKFAKGTEYLNGNPGTDTNLIYANTGERIVSKEDNQHLRGIQNSELPKLAAIYREGPMTRNEMREMVRAQNETTKAINRIKIYKTDLTEKGLAKTVENTQARTKILNEQFPNAR